MAQDIRIDCDFPGGNIVVESQDGDDIRVHQDLRDTAGDWFYWCFRVRGAAGRTLRFHFTQSLAIGVRGPAFSLNRGRTWRWLGKQGGEDRGFVFSFPKEPDEVRFSFGMPYQVAHWRAFCRTLRAKPLFRTDELCRTGKGRVVECARFGCIDVEPAVRVAITCRHHCCEMMANYVLEGLIRFVLSGRQPEATWLRTQVEFLVVPFVDLDGVEDGDQGKNRQPRDHGRDYLGTSIHPSTAALRERLPQWFAGSPATLLDLHCPWIRGDHNEVVYLVGTVAERIAAQQVVFSRLLEAKRQGELPFAASDLLPFGTSWNTAGNFAGGMSIVRWATGLPGMRLATSIEVPYANAGGTEVNQGSAASFGADLARALATYLMAGQSRTPG